ncbi:MAG: hypothetical protein ABMA15_02570 [Vicinamibacterales bacterium]
MSIRLVARHGASIGTIACCLVLLPPLAALGHAAADSHEYVVVKTRNRVATLAKELAAAGTKTDLQERFQQACSFVDVNGAEAAREVEHRCEEARRQGIQALAMKESDRQEATGNRVLARIWRTVDEYVSTAVDPKQVDANSVFDDLKRILDPLGEDAQSLFVSVWKHEESDGARSSTDANRKPSPARALIVGGEIHAPFMRSSVTLRAYNVAGRHFMLMDVTGEELTDYSDVSTRELRANGATLSSTKAAWFLMWGQMIGANGPNIRMRAYAYNGTRFRPVWVPEDEWGYWTVTVTATGFVVDGNYYHSDKVRHDEYVLGDGGVTLIR